MMLTGEAKREYQRKYMQEYMRKKRGGVLTEVSQGLNKTEEEVLRPDVVEIPACPRGINANVWAIQHSGKVAE
jgi:hypothetical protein